MIQGNKKLSILGLVLLSACGVQKQTPSVEAISSEVANSTDASDLSKPFNFHQSKIIGINPLIPVKADGSNLDSSLRSAINAFGLLEIGTDGACTATHIGGGIVLTAGHCFLENASSPTASHQSCPDYKVKWGYRGSPANGSATPVVTMESQCTELLYAEQSNQRDFAVFKVDQAPKEFISIALESKDTAPNTKITIFGYPQARPLEWSQYCSVHNSADAGHGLYKSTQFVHQCDTEPGNSGSTILAISSSGELKVMGIHDGAAPNPVKFNYGTYMFEMRKVLKANNIDIDHLMSSSSLNIKKKKKQG